MRNRYYITTPIYYPSNRLTVGNAYTTVIADSLARRQRMMGKEVMFLTGADEHGLKLARIAQNKGLSPKVYVDHMVEGGVKDLWRLMNISYDRFIRTTDSYHVKAVQEIFTRLYEQGDIYLGDYEGLYCTPCEAFWTEGQLVDGCCPDCGRAVEKMTESCYFFKLSKYQQRLEDYYRDHPEFIEPHSRMNEMLNNFIRPGLEDLAVSRSSFSWGVPVPFDQKHVVYVWIDALSNYLTALGYPDQSAEIQEFWPADLQLVGKDIARFHAIIWPILLMALDLPLPQKVFGHGWLLMRGDKMSKSKGNALNPYALADIFGVDAIRYFLLREIQFGQDGNFSAEALISRINSDLANDLGNLLSRTVAMIVKYFPGGLPAERESAEPDEELLETGRKCREGVDKALEDLEISVALERVWDFVRRLNKYIDETSPWVLARDEGKKGRLAEVLYQLADGLRRVSLLIAPFMPETAARMDEQLGIERPGRQNNSAGLSWAEAGETGRYPVGKALVKGDGLFPRLDLEETLSRMAEKEDEYEVEYEAAEMAFLEANRLPQAD